MIEEIKVSELLKLIKVLNVNEKNNESIFFEIGKSYFIRTVTMHLIGKLKNIKDKEIILEHAVWVADSGRFHNALKDGTLNEVEPFVSDVLLNKECIVDACEWLHKIPTEQK